MPNESLNLPLTVVDIKGERSILLQNFTKRFVAEVDDFLGNLQERRALGFDMSPVVRQEALQVLTFTPKVQSLLNKRKASNIGKEPITQEERQALKEYLVWSYQRNESEDIRNGTHEPLCVASDHLRELYRKMTGLNEPTATYTMPIMRYDQNSTESNWQLGYNL